MTAMIWILLPLFVAAGSALLSFYIMQARLEVAVAREREQLAAAEATIRSNAVLLEEKVRAAEEATQRRSFDQFLNEFRVEERHYMRENRLPDGTRKSLVLQERLYFRNIPLSNWVENEMMVESGADAHSLAQDHSAFHTRALGGEAPIFRSHQLTRQSAAAGV